MATVTLDYKYDNNAWRTSGDDNFNINDSGWVRVGILEKDVAYSFIDERKQEQKTNPLLRFKDVENIRHLLKIHTGVFIAKTKNQEYARAGINKKVFHI